jgi:xanthine dehydrogenase YagS FAD-binding subunit
MKTFSYVAPATLQQALSQIGAAARPLAGGTDLVTLMKACLVEPERLVALRGLLPTAISEDQAGLTIGAGATLADLERDARVARSFTALGEAAAAAASQQLRNVATLGGNLLQRPRCWYFRHPEVHCWLKGGSECQALHGENRQHALFSSEASPCVAVHPSDLAAALLALDARLRIAGAQAERIVGIGDFFALPEEGRRRETTLADGELILDLRLPPHPEATRSTYLKAMDRHAFSFALVGVAAVLRLSPKRRIEHARLVLSGVAPVPWCVGAAERLLLGAEAGDALFEEAAAAAVAGATPLQHNAFKVPLARALVKRALQALAARP